jgi:hypothetical protein
MTREQIVARWPFASEDFIEANLSAGSDAQGAVIERPVRHEPLAAKERKGGHPSRLHVRITSVRGRLIDADNLCAKFFTDCLRYCGAIQDDSPEFVTIETRQRKAEDGEAHATIIEIFTGTE